MLCQIHAVLIFFFFLSVFSTGTHLKCTHTKFIFISTESYILVLRQIFFFCLLLSSKMLVNHRDQCLIPPLRSWSVGPGPPSRPPSTTYSTFWRLFHACGKVFKKHRINRIDTSVYIWDLLRVLCVLSWSRGSPAIGYL